LLASKGIERRSMEFARIADSQARSAFAVWADDDIAAVQKEEDMAAEVAYIDRLIAEVDRELADQERVKHRFTDQRRARRERRRAEGGVLRSLPTRLTPPRAGGSEAA